MRSYPCIELEYFGGDGGAIGEHVHRGDVTGNHQLICSDVCY